jgi:hypothetical protein
MRERRPRPSGHAEVQYGAGGDEKRLSARPPDHPCPIACNGLGTVLAIRSRVMIELEHTGNNPVKGKAASP